MSCPRTNEHGKVLIENWVEERACAQYDDSQTTPVINSSGHPGIITTSCPATENVCTTVQDMYRPPSRPNIRSKGIRQAMLEEAVYNKISHEVEEEYKPPKISPDYTSTMHKDYSREFNSDWPVPVTHHNLLKELPVSYWTATDGIPGTTQVRCEGSPFKKNAAFSTPTEIYQDQAKPYESDTVSMPH